MAKADSTTADDTTVAPYEEWKLAELQDELRARQMPTSGTKPELVERLSAADRTPAEMTVPELQDELRDKDLPVSGTKAELVDRLESSDDTGAAAAAVDPTQCVVDDGTAHMGRAVNGVVCSAHANRYKADGTPRGQ